MICGIGEHGEEIKKAASDGGQFEIKGINDARQSTTLRLFAAKNRSRQRVRNARARRLSSEALIVPGEKVKTASGTMGACVWRMRRSGRVSDRLSARARI